MRQDKFSHTGSGYFAARSISRPGSLDMGSLRPARARISPLAAGQPADESLVKPDAAN